MYLLLQFIVFFILIVNLFKKDDVIQVMHPKLLDRLNYESKGENKGRIRNWGTLLNSQHFRGRGARWSFGMGIRTIDKWVNYSCGHAQTKQQVG